MAIEPLFSTLQPLASPQSDGFNTPQPTSPSSPSLPPDGDAAYVNLSQDAAQRKNPPGAEVEQQSEPPKSAPSEAQSSAQLSSEEKEEIRELQKRDREVRTHEQAHLSALGAYKSGGATFSMTTGPDGRQYAVGGEVPVDVSPEKTPEETIRKAQTIRRAALAPADPSGADRSVAAQASQMEAQARAELAREQQSGNSGSGSRESNGETSLTESTPTGRASKEEVGADVDTQVRRSARASYRAQQQLSTSEQSQRLLARA